MFTNIHYIHYQNGNYISKKRRIKSINVNALMIKELFDDKVILFTDNNDVPFAVYYFNNDIKNHYWEIIDKIKNKGYCQIYCYRSEIVANDDIDNHIGHASNRVCPTSWGWDLVD